MAVAAAQPIRLTVTLPPRRVVIAIASSIALHAGLGIGLYSYTQRSGASTAQAPAAIGVASDLALAMQGMQPVLVATPKSMPEPPPAPTPKPAANTSQDSPLKQEPAAVGSRVQPHVEIEVTPGIDESDADTPNWLGAAKGTEHRATKSVTEQPALSRDPGRRGNDELPEGQPNAQAHSEPGEGGSGNGSGGGKGDGTGDAGDQAPRGEDIRREESQARHGRTGTDAGTEDGSSQKGAVPREAATASHAQGAGEKPVPPKPEDITGLMPEQNPIPAEPPQPLVEPSEAEKPSGLAIDPQAATDASVLGALTPAAAAGGQTPSVRPGSESKVPGKKSDAESPPSSREISTTFRPGMPLAHEGLRVRPKLPRYTMTTRAMSRPKNPSVVIKFNRAGKVVKAEFAPGRTTGSADWDGPLLASLYEWTATGKRLQELPINDPEAVLVLRLDYLLSE